MYCDECLCIWYSFSQCYNHAVFVHIFYVHTFHCSQKLYVNKSVALSCICMSLVFICLFMFTHTRVWHIYKSLPSLYASVLGNTFSCLFLQCNSTEYGTDFSKHKMHLPVATGLSGWTKCRKSRKHSENKPDKILYMCFWIKLRILSPVSSSWWK